MSATLFQLDQVGVRFGSAWALRDCTLGIKAGESVALVGGNGSGKSTLLRCLHGLQSASSGRIERAPVAQAMVFQRPFVLRSSARSNIALALWLRGVPWRQGLERADAALERVGLAEQAKCNARTLSGGQQQRLALARAWALQAQVLLLDEPTAALDPAGKREVEHLMAQFAQAGMTLIFASHNLGQVKRLANRVLYLEDGRLLVDWPAQRFFSDHLPDGAAAFLKGESV
jgi:tungstate transport system ATP-binding protein